MSEHENAPAAPPEGEDDDELVRALYEAFCRSERIVAKWDNESPGTREHWAGTAREAIAAGVTLAPPARVSPLEAALRNVLATWDSWDAAERKRYSDEVWRERLAACRAFEDAVASARAALLARLTEGGA